MLGFLPRIPVGETALPADLAGRKGFELSIRFTAAEMSIRSQLSHFSAPNPADFTQRLSSCRFYERKFASKIRSARSLKKRRFFKGLKLSCGDRI